MARAKGTPTPWMKGRPPLPPDQKRKMKSMKLHPALLERLAKASEITHQSEAFIMESALEQYLSQLEKTYCG